MRKLTFLVVLTVVAFLVQASAHADSRDWTLIDTEGNSFNYSSVRGNAPTLLIFWATWCVPCKEELSKHEALFKSYEKKGIQVLLISEDTPRTQSRVKPYIESKRFTWRVLLDPNSEVLKRYSGVKLPYTVLLDKNGIPVMKILNALTDTQALTAQVDKLTGAGSD